eukprot:jgi/Botrbrau1/22444/Bobra.0091s0046.1
MAVLGRTKKLPKKRSSVKRKREQEEAFQDEDHDEFFDNEDDGPTAKVQDEEEDDDDLKETPEEARRRLVKDYIARLKQTQGHAGSDEDGEGAGRDTVGDLLRKEALELTGKLRQNLARRVVVPPVQPYSEGDARNRTPVLKGHRKAVTAVCVTWDGARAFSVCKEGLVLETDLESGRKSYLAFPNEEARMIPSTGTPATWVKRGPKRIARESLLAVAVSWDGQYLAAGGGDQRVHVWDLRSRQYLEGFTGHRDAVSALAFREGTHELYSASLDRSIRLWSVDDVAAVTTLHGHQSEILAVDVGRGSGRCPREETAAVDCGRWKMRYSSCTMRKLRLSTAVSL